VEVRLELLEHLALTQYSQQSHQPVAVAVVDLVLVVLVVQVVADIILQTLVEQELQAQFKEIMVEPVNLMNSAAAEVEQVQLATVVQVA
jgi:hypothetical protein